MACRLTRKGVKPCKGLSMVMQLPGGQGTRRQGVELKPLINMKTGKFSRHLVVLRSGEFGKNGVVMNNCPFCCGKLYEPEPREARANMRTPTRRT